VTGSIISGERQLSLDTLQERAARAAKGLAALGVREGDRVALLLRNDIAFLEASLAAIRLGVYPVPINWHNTAEEVAYVLADCGARVLVAHADLLRAVRDAVPAGLRVLGVPTPPEIAAAYALAAAETALPADVEEWDGWVAGHVPATAAPLPFRGSIIYTSGTTGRPKGVRRQPMNAAQDARRAEVSAAVFGIRPELRCVITGTLYHSAPNGYALAALRAGGTLVLQPRFDAEGLLALIERHRITHLHMVPTMFVRLLRLPQATRERYDVSSLEWVIHGAAPCPPEVKEAMIRWWGPVLYEYYGSTETGLNTCASSADWLSHPGTVGRPVQGSSVRIVDDDGTLLGANQVGQVYLRQDALSDFTYHRQHQYRQQIEQDGHVSVGDIGYLDADGYLFLCDRKIDMIISGGVNIYPAEIEAVLITMPGVQDCAIFGIPDDEFGERVVAAIQPEPGARLADEAVLAYLRPHVAAYKLPRRIEYHEALPREDSGKIFKRKLRDPYWEGRPLAI
jgi:long-chain acyl-CoA synthetase